MTTQEVKRKLAAILSADVKGYSRLMSQDEVGTIRTLDAYKNAMSEMVVRYKGCVVDSIGDNLMAEFGSVVDAVNCAVEVQRELAERNAEIPYNRRMEFRIGINLGDVVEEQGKIYGDGVNIAARLQSLAEGGGICISGTVYDQVKSKLGLEYEHLGEQTVKNIAEPVRVYRVLSFPGAAAHRVVQAKSAVVTRYRRAALAIAVVLLIGVGSVLTWHFFLRPVPPPVEVASIEKMAFPLPDKPSIAVLPFVSMSGDKEQEYFSDGITENIITALSKVPRLFVISRQSTFFYKGKPVKVKQVSEELGVRYVLEGSVQRSTDRVRISAQLIDALSGHHLWAERYDRDLKDIFALQDEITLKITTVLQVKLTAGEQARVMAKGTTNLEAYLKALQCREYGQRWTKEGNTACRKYAEEVIALDPKYPFGYVALGLTHGVDVLLGLSESPQQSMARAIELAKKAISLDDSFSLAHSALGAFYATARQYDKGVAEAERAVALEPNSAENLFFLAFVLCYAGKPEEAIPLTERAVRLNPIPLPFQLVTMAHAYRLTGRYEKAIEAAKRAIQVEPNSQLAHVHLIASYIGLGREKEARAEAPELLRINPKFSADHYSKRIPYKNQADNDRLADALHKAGLK
jgi:adenylate cyclase